MKVLDKKLLRDIRQSKGQVIAVSIVITCGIAVFVAFYACYQNLLLSRDLYFSSNRFYDFSIQFEKAPLTSVFKIKEIPGVRDARGRIVKDVSLETENDDTSKVARIISLPVQEENVINGIHIISGRNFSRAVYDECVVNQDFFKANNLKPGDRIKVTTNGKKQTLKVVGSALSPEYVYAIRNAQEMIPNPQKFAIVWVNQKWAEGSFDLKGFYNEIIGEVYNPEDTDKILDRADTLLKPYGVYARVEKKDQLSYWYLENEIVQLKVSAQVTPLIFLTVADLILLILLSRMVKRERNQIGLLKAYGYSNVMVAGHYLKFALLIGLLGGFMGFILGQWLGRSMMQMYVTFFSFPVLEFRLNPDLFFWSVFISVGSAGISALFAVRSIIKIMPADAMRDKPPVSASRTFLENIGILWNSLSFTNKIIFRNISRYPLRSAFTVLGVTLSAAILLMGYFTRDAMDYMLKHQFEKIQREDVRVTLYTERGREALYEAMRLPYVRKAEPLLMYPFELTNGWRKKEMLITGVPDNSSLYRLIDTEDNIISIDGNGIVILDKTARELGVRVGDTITVKPLIGKSENEKKVVVGKIVQQYFGTGAYMDIEALSRVLNLSVAINAVLLKVDSEHLSELNTVLKDIPVIASVENKKDSIDNINKTIAESMAISNFFLTFFAGVIAVAVIYNSTVISITERKREIASLRVLGFTNSEVSRIVFNENIYLSFLGLLLGLPFGAWMCSLMTTAYDTDLFRFPFYISNTTYITCSVTIMVFVFATNLFLRKKVTSLNMVESLKTRE